jgi:type I restriction-modification system DNA methylase subunit
MSEELNRKNLQKNGIFIGNYEYYPIGNTSINQLKNHAIVSPVDYKKYGKLKPDALLVYRNNKKNPQVIVVIEHKQPDDFRTDKQKKEACEQCNTYCQVLKAKIGIVTDGNNYIWFNPNHPNDNNKYKDDFGKQRSYTIIYNEDQKPLSQSFILQEISEKDINKLNDDVGDSLYYFDRAIESINTSNSVLKTKIEVDPINLAKSVWQDIYVNTGKDPTKCLYNVVELFIFKFLSDLGVLMSPYDFNTVIGLQKNNKPTEIIDYYAKNSRKKIIELFPKGNDNTTIINGTIFVNASGEAVLSQASLFVNSLKKYEKFGSLKNIKKEFKTKLFETFLKQSQDKSKLGQFFTPRKIVTAIVEMSDVEKLQDNSKICDPFCGVGGFVLEPINIYKSTIQKRFIPKTGEIKPQIIFNGFDKGTDADEERTIILAKANMLIYLSDIIEKYSNNTKEFSKLFNDTFKLLRNSNLGTLSMTINKEADKYDLIMTNIPYITSGSKSLKLEIKQQGLGDYYTSNGKGVEGLALEWIIRNLKSEGRAFIVVPDSILNARQNETLKGFIKNECFINGIISLPVNTFFTTPKKTYILIITKKSNRQDSQNAPVFTYIVSNIGETLDVNRFEIPGDSDLKKAKELYNAYKGSPDTFNNILQQDNKRCKLIPIEEFNPRNSWIIENWRTEEEKKEIGLIEEKIMVNFDDFIRKLNDLKIKKIKNTTNKIKNIKFSNIFIPVIFDLKKTTNKSWFTKEFVDKHKGNIPVYSASKDPNVIYGHIKDGLPDVKYFEDCLTWNIDGSMGIVHYRKGKFSLSEKVVPLIIKDDFKNTLDQNYLKYVITDIAKKLNFSFANKAGKNKLKDMGIPIPVKENGKYDLKKQKELVRIYEFIEQSKNEIINKLNDIVNTNVKIL